MSRETSSYLRRLGVWDAAMIVIGGVIGAGIFRTPSTIAERTSGSLQMMALWVIGGLVTLAGALCFAELGARRPQAGGTYIYLREAWGPLSAFLCGWTITLIIYPGNVAAVATTFADYLCPVLGLPPVFVQPLAVAAIVFIVGFNLFGVRAGAWVQNIFTVLKLLAIALLVMVGLVLARTRLGLAFAPPEKAAVSAWTLVGAMMPVMFAYGGFNYVNNLAGEVREPQRTLPRALGLGMLGVIACYVLVNLAYLVGLGHAGLAASKAPAADVMSRLFGSSGATVIALGIACSTFGYCNVALSGGARVLQTMGADGLFFPAVGRLDARFHVPRLALIVLGLWSIVLTVSGSFGQLLNYATVGDWLTYAAGIATLFRYRRHGADEAVSYSAPLFPLLPLAFIAMVLGVVAVTAINAPADAGMSLVIIALGAPVYYGWRHWSRTRSA
ncbi:MAG TPA: amino acid permease [Rhodanobacter sp.]|nr:amino acid permease [Rhodanobacter sp.]